MSFIPPVVALVIAGSWLAIQHQSITKLEQESSILRKSVAARSSGAEDDSPGAKKARSAKAANEKELLDWEKMAAVFAKIRVNRNWGDKCYMRTRMCFKHRLSTMTKEELLVALDKIAAMDIIEGDRQDLENRAVMSLIQKDPEFALTFFIDRINEQSSIITDRLTEALHEWAKEDPAKAAAWFDQQIAAGKFGSKSLDGHSRASGQFKGALISVLLASDPDAAGRHLSTIPEDRRCVVLINREFESLKEENQLAFAELVRSQVPADDQAYTIAHQASNLVSGDGYSKVTEYLDRIEATPAERAKCAEEAAYWKLRIHDDKKVTRENLDEMREWVTSQAPEALASITGKSLGNAIEGDHKMEFSEAADLALQYNQISGNDDVLSSFLENWPADKNKEQARALAEKITDKVRRKEILELLE